MDTKDLKVFYNSVRKTLFVCRLHGLLPITGLLNRNSANSRCVWFSPYTIFYIISVGLMQGATVLHLYDAVTTSRRHKDLDGLLSEFTASVGLIYLLRFSLAWEHLLKKIEDNERLLPPFDNAQRVVKKINCIMFYLFLLTISEQIVRLLFIVRVLSLCANVETFKYYYIGYFGWFFDHVPFNYGTAFLVQVIHLQTKFIFSYIDGLVTVFSLYLVCRFRNFNRLMAVKQRTCIQRRSMLWTELQAHYTRLSRMVKVIDDNINPLVFITFLSHLIFIIKKIYDFIQKQKSVSANENNPDCIIANSSDWSVVLHLLGTTAFLLFKALVVSTVTSYIYTLSRQPLNALHSVPSSAYNFEMQRFMDQVYHSNVSLSGLQFFYVTRGIILLMLSTVITYELVLLQLPLIY